MCIGHDDDFPAITLAIENGGEKFNYRRRAARGVRLGISQKKTPPEHAFKARRIGNTCRGAAAFYRRKGAPIPFR
jgi:hypothetical protein